MSELMSELTSWYVGTMFLSVAADPCHGAIKWHCCWGD